MLESSQKTQVAPSSPAALASESASTALSVSPQDASHSPIFASPPRRGSLLSETSSPGSPQSPKSVGGRHRPYALKRFHLPEILLSFRDVPLKLSQDETLAKLKISLEKSVTRHHHKQRCIDRELINQLYVEYLRQGGNTPNFVTLCLEIPELYDYFDAIIHRRLQGFRHTALEKGINSRLSELQSANTQNILDIHLINSIALHATTLESLSIAQLKLLFRFATTETLTRLVKTLLADIQRQDSMAALHASYQRLAPLFSDQVVAKFHMEAHYLYLVALEYFFTHFFKDAHHHLSIDIYGRFISRRLADALNFAERNEKDICDAENYLEPLRVALWQEIRYLAKHLANPDGVAPALERLRLNFFIFLYDHPEADVASLMPVYAYHLNSMLAEQNPSSQTSSYTLWHEAPADAPVLLKSLDRFRRSLGEITAGDLKRHFAEYPNRLKGYVDGFSCARETEPYEKPVARLGM